MSTRCTGHCCQAFVLPFTPQEVRSYSFWRRGGDHRKVAAMVLHLGAQADPAVRGLHGHVGHCVRHERTPGFEDLHFYTCRHYQADTGNCGNYADRPDMCRGYPYGARCYYPGCEWDVAVDGVGPNDRDGRILRGSHRLGTFIDWESAASAIHPTMAWGWDGPGLPLAAVPPVLKASGSRKGVPALRQPELGRLWSMLGARWLDRARWALSIARVLVVEAHRAARTDRGW